MARLPDNPAELGRFSHQRWRDLDGYYRFHTERWRRTLDYLRSQHWEVTKQYDLTMLPKWKRFKTVNYLTPFYNDFLTDWLKSEIRYSAVPESTQAEDVAAAELADQVLKYLWDLLDFNQLRLDLGAWVIATGNAALRVFWNRNTGNLVPVGMPSPQNPNPELTDEGEIGVEVISPQFVRYGMKPAEGTMLGLMLTEDEALQVYGPEVVAQLSFTDAHAGISMDLNQIQFPNMGSQPDKRALVIEHYLPKSNQNPDGLWWTSSSGGDLLISQPAPLPAGGVPVIPFRWSPWPGDRNLGSSPLYDMTFVNKTYDEALSRTMEWMDKTVPKTLLKVGGGIAVGDLTDEPAQELPVNSGGEPEVFQFASPPDIFFDMMDRAQQDLATIGGVQFEKADEIPEGIASVGRVPGELKPGSKVALAILSSKSAWEQTGEVLLGYVGKFYTGQRMISIQGPDKLYQSRAFSGADLKDLPAKIHVDELPLYPWNRQATRDAVIGVLASPGGQILFADESGAPDMKKIKRAMEAAGLDASIDELDEDIMEARNEQVMFQNLQDPNQAPQIKPFQNHATHWDEHSSILKSMTFQAWPPQAQQAFLQHFEQTEEILNQQAQEEAQAMIEQERALRQVREQEELKADVQRKLAEEVIELVLGEIAEEFGVDREIVLQRAIQQMQPNEEAE